MHAVMGPLHRRMHAPLPRRCVDGSGHCSKGLGSRVHRNICRQAACCKHAPCIGMQLQGLMYLAADVTLWKGLRLTGSVSTATPAGQSPPVNVPELVSFSST